VIDPTWACIACMRAGARRDIGTGTAQSEEAAAPRAQLARHRFTKLSCTEAPATPRSVHTDKLRPSTRLTQRAVS